MLHHLGGVGIPVSLRHNGLSMIGIRGSSGWSRAEDGQGADGPTICTAGVPTAEMACGVDPGASVLEGREGSNILANWTTDIGVAVDGGGGNKAGEVEDVLGTIAGDGGSSGAITSARGGRQW
jgi:hypothetical protein